MALTHIMIRKAQFAILSMVQIHADFGLFSADGFGTESTTVLHKKFHDDTQLGTVLGYTNIQLRIHF